MVCPRWIRALNAASSFEMSWKCSPVVGSSKMNMTPPCAESFVRNEASFTRWLSPPERVDDDCPSLMYPSPTSCNGCSRSTMRLQVEFLHSSPKKATASSTVISSTS